LRIGVFGGSFDPVHAGHLRLAEAAFSELNLDRVVFVPAAQAPLKGRSMLPARERLRRVRRAVAGKPRFEVSRCELDRRGVSYTVDTLKYFKRRYGKAAALYFLCGADSARTLGRWKSFPEVLKLCRFVVLSRPGYRIGRLPDGALRLDFDAVDVSSTGIRRRLQSNGGRSSNPRKRSI
jgi:nicotinate-nucleotide adenylyltransferase